MKKIISKILVLVVSFMLFTGYVLAADFNYSITSKDVTVGNSVTLTIDGTGSSLKGRFNVSSSNSGVASVSTSSVWIENNRQTVTISGKKAGTAVITISPTDGVSDADANSISLTPKTITITVKDKPVVVDSGTTNNNTGNNNSNVIQAKPKSSNNYLTSLSVEGFKLDSDFDREKLEYTVTVKEDTEKVKINAQLADSSAKVTGVGEHEVKTGLNTIEVVVTAENGNKKTYTIKINVPEVLPTIVKVDGVEYSLVKNKDELPEISEYYEVKEVTIDKDTIPGYYSQTLGYTLVGLKDSTGKVNYYIYKNGKYTLYKEYRFGGTTLQILDKDINKGYKKTSFNYGGDKIPSYQEVKLDLIKNTYALDNNDITGNQFYLFYAKNVETGKENLYQYDAVEKTVQRYNTEVLDMVKKNSDTYYMYVLILLLVVGFLILLLSLLSIKNGKLKKEIKNTVKKKAQDNDEE